MLESFATWSACFPACWNLSRRGRHAFQHAGILRDVVGMLSSMLESFATWPARFPACWNLSRRGRHAFQHAGILRDHVFLPPYTIAFVGKDKGVKDKSQDFYLCCSTCFSIFPVR